VSEPFVHLHLHTEYSLSDGLVRLAPLAGKAASEGMPAVAMTDRMNLFGMVKFHKAALAAGVKPIIGVDLLVDTGEATPCVLTVLCRNGTGYRNLTRLVSRGYLEGRRGGEALVQREWVEEAAEGLIALSGANEGDVGRALLAGREDDAERMARRWAGVFDGDYHLEVRRTGRDGDEAQTSAAAALAERTGIPLVATNDVRFLDPEDFQAHEIRVAIREGRRLEESDRPRNHSRQQYLRSPGEMAELFADLPEAVANTASIARRCNLPLELGVNHLPDFPLPEGVSASGHLRQTAREGLEERLAQLGKTSPEARRPYDERLEHELDVIEDMGFPGYFLIVADFIGWARENGVPVGPGRGSGAGSLVAYSIGITDLDPLAYNLLFERFLNPERVSMPDFDVDFGMEGRDRVIEYVADRYGREKVSQIITFGTMAARAVVKDVGRVLGHPYGYMDRVAKTIPFEVGMTLGKAVEDDPDFRALYKNEPEVHDLVDLARPLEGVARNAGKHAGGVVIAPSELTDFTPLYREEDGESVVTQFDKDDVEKIGLVKFDFLGLRTLTIIDKAVRTVNARRRAEGGGEIDIRSIPMDDPGTFKAIQAGHTAAVFQLESRGMTELVGRMQPEVFEDLIALVALFRPGPLQSGMVDDFINRKHGRERIAYPHPDLESILKPTYGVILYQEQVMQIAQRLAGYTLGAADLLRRAMGKKKPEEMAKQRKVFMRGATERGVDAGVAQHIFDLMEKFAGYGFNKSHSAAYALLSYQTAWLKAHHPEAFMASVMSADMDNTDKLLPMVIECRRLGIPVLPPDVNVSVRDFTVADGGAIRYGLGAIKGIGADAVRAVVSEREANGPYRSLHDLCRRVDSKRVNRRTLENMVRAGALDGVEPTRAGAMQALPDAMRAAEQGGRAEQAGQGDLFGMAPETPDTPGEETRSGGVVQEWPLRERLTAEREALGFYLTGHPLDEHQDDLAGITRHIADVASWIERNPGKRLKGVTLAGMVVGMRKKNGHAFLTLDENDARIELPLFEDTYAKYKRIAVKDALLVVEGEVSEDKFSGGCRILPTHVMGIDEAMVRYARDTVVRLPGQPGSVSRSFVDDLESSIKPSTGDDASCPVSVYGRNGKAQYRMGLPENWRIAPDRETIRRMQRNLGPEGARVVYRDPEPEESDEEPGMRN